jgi:hypothetical protein
LLLLATGSLLLARFRGGAVTRGASAGIVVVSPAGDVAPAVAFVWHGVPGALEYRVEIVDADAAAVWCASTADTALALPPSAGLAPDRDYRWWVSAPLPDGARVRSRTTTFRLRPR